MLKNNVMLVSNYIKVFWVCLSFSVPAKALVVEKLIHVKVKYKNLLSEEMKPMLGSVISSSVLGEYVIDLKSLLKNDAVELVDSDIILYGLDTNLLYAKCSSESLRKINDLYGVSVETKSAYRLRIEISEKAESPKSPYEMLLDCTVISGELTEYKLSEDSRMELIFTEGIEGEGELQYEIRISGLALLAKADIPATNSYKVEIAKPKIVHRFESQNGLEKFLRVRLDRLVLNNNIESIIDNSDVQSQMLSLIHKEVANSKYFNHRPPDK